MYTSPISIGNVSQNPPSSGSDPEFQAVLAVEYSAKAGGTTYTANVDSFDGEFEARVPNLPGASATGQTLQQVENDLGNLISFFA
jgi:hypothetical protein